MAMISLLRLSTPKVNERGDRNGQRGDLVEHVGRQVDQIRSHGSEWNVIANNVAHQFEEGGHQHEQHKTRSAPGRMYQGIRGQRTSQECAERPLRDLARCGPRLQLVEKANERDAVLPNRAFRPGLWQPRNQPEMAAKTCPPLAICQSRKVPTPAKRRFADHTARNTGSLLWRPRAVPVKERK